jgi:thiol peroxidase
MAKITLQGITIHTSGDLPENGTRAHDFKLISKDLSVKSLADFEGKNLILNIFPSIDTGVCAESVRNFNKLSSSLDNTVVLCISRDLPFAQSRFCGAEGIDNVLALSDFNTGQFGKDYGLDILDGAFAGLHSRAIVVIDKEGRITYTEQIPEIAQEPNYDLALASL